jgi:hypothetical protein
VYSDIEILTKFDSEITITYNAIAVMSRADVAGWGIAGLSARFLWRWEYLLFN